MYVLVALQAVAALGTSLFWQPIGEFDSHDTCKAASMQLHNAKKEHKEGELYICLKK